MQEESKYKQYFSFSSSSIFSNLSLQHLLLPIQPTSPLQLLSSSLSLTSHNNNNSRSSLFLLTSSHFQLQFATSVFQTDVSTVEHAPTMATHITVSVQSNTTDHLANVSQAFLFCSLKCCFCKHKIYSKMVLAINFCWL